MKLIYLLWDYSPFKAMIEFFEDKSLTSKPKKP